MAEWTDIAQAVAAAAATVAAALTWRASKDAARAAASSAAAAHDANAVARESVAVQRKSNEILAAANTVLEATRADALARQEEGVRAEAETTINAVSLGIGLLQMIEPPPNGWIPGTPTVASWRHDVEVAASNLRDVLHLAHRLGSPAEIRIRGAVGMLQRFNAAAAAAETDGHLLHKAGAGACRQCESSAGLVASALASLWKAMELTGPEDHAPAPRQPPANESV